MGRLEERQEEEPFKMTHREIEEPLNENLDDLKVRDPKAYRSIERDLNILKIRSDIAVAKAPAFQRMERLH